MLKKVLFAHDGPLYKDKEGNYYGVTLNDSVRKRFLALGDSVTFIIRVNQIDTDDPPRKLSLIQGPAFNVIELPNAKSIRGFFKNYLKVRSIISKAVEEHDVLVARIPSLTGKLAFHSAKKLTKPTIVECVGCTFDAYWNYNWKGKLIAHYKRFQQAQILKNASHAVYVTNEFLQKRYPTAGESVSCSNVELKAWNDNYLSARLERIAAFDKSRKIVLGTAAALIPYKGQDDVVRAISILHKKGFQFEYRIAGNGDPAYLERIIAKEDVADQVKILGPVPHDKIFEFYSELDIYIQPSKQEGLPRAMIEAMSTACPCLGARTAGIPELIDSAYIFKPGNYVDLAQIISRIDKEALRAMAEDNFRNAKDYRLEVIDDRRHDFYKRFREQFHL